MNGYIEQFNLPQPRDTTRPLMNVWDGITYISFPSVFCRMPHPYAVSLHVILALG